MRKMHGWAGLDEGCAAAFLTHHGMHVLMHAQKAGADAAQAAAGEESGGTGIILKRMGKPTGGAAAGAGAVRTNDTQVGFRLGLCLDMHAWALCPCYAAHLGRCMLPGARKNMRPEGAPGRHAGVLQKGTA